MVSLFIFSLLIVPFIVGHNWRLWPWQQITAHILSQPLHDRSCKTIESTYVDGSLCSWELTTAEFVPNHDQSSPYVADGYFGQRLLAEGVGYWIYVAALENMSRTVGIRIS